MTFDPELPALQPHGYDQPGTEPLDLHNNGHTGKSLGSKEFKSPVQILGAKGKKYFHNVRFQKAPSMNLEI